MANSQDRILTVTAFFVWAGVVIGSFYGLARYANMHGSAGNAALVWPVNAGLQIHGDRPTLVLFAHPHCPCSEASLSELERMLPALKDRMNIKTVFVKSQTQSADWAQEALWEKAVAMRFVDVVLDDEGKIAQQFGALTSGQVYLYDRHGQLAFSGGITPERGHMGASLGENAILEFNQTGYTQVHSSPVFGCSLKNPERANVWKVTQEEHNDHLHHH